MLASLFAIATTFFAIQAVHGLSLQPSSEDFTTESQPRHAERHERRQQIIVVNQTAVSSKPPRLCTSRSSDHCSLFLKHVRTETRRRYRIARPRCEHYCRARWSFLTCLGTKTSASRSAPTARKNTANGKIASCPMIMMRLNAPTRSSASTIAPI